VTVGGVSEDTIRNVENLAGGSAADKLTGDSLANLLEGNGGGDTLKGGAGNDVLNGGAGIDTLEGGTGQDRFVFDAALDASANVDRILSFSVADDTIALDDAVFSALDEGALGEGEFALGSAATDPLHRILYDPSTGALRYDADGLGGAEAMQFATLTAGMSLSEADFLVV
jgi:serralysin